MKFSDEKPIYTTTLALNSLIHSLKKYWSYVPIQRARLTTVLGFASFTLTLAATSINNVRENLRNAKKEYNKTEDDLKSFQSVGQIIGEVLRPLDNERLIVKASSGPRYVVGCRSKVDKEKLTSGTRVVLDMTTLTIMRALPREVDPVVYSMLHEDPGNVSYSAVGGLSDQIRELRESIELPLMNPELFLRVGIKPPKGVLLYEPPGTGNTLLARAIASNIDANFLKDVSSAIIDKYIGESARLIREMFGYARDHQRPIKKSIAGPILMLGELRRRKLNHGGDGNCQRSKSRRYCCCSIDRGIRSNNLFDMKKPDCPNIDCNFLSGFHFQRKSLILWPVIQRKGRIRFLRSSSPLLYSFILSSLLQGDGNCQVIFHFNNISDIDRGSRSNNLFDMKVYLCIDYLCSYPGKALVPAKLMTSLELLQKGPIIGRIAGSLSPIIARFIVIVGHCIGIMFQPLWIEPRSKKCVSGSPPGVWNSSWELIPSFTLLFFFVVFVNLKGTTSSYMNFTPLALGCHLIWVKNGNAGQAKVSNSRGEASVSTFNEEAEKILGFITEDRDKLRSKQDLYCHSAFFLRGVGGGGGGEGGGELDQSPTVFNEDDAVDLSPSSMCSLKSGNTNNSTTSPDIVVSSSIGGCLDTGQFMYQKGILGNGHNGNIENWRDSGLATTTGGNDHSQSQQTDTSTDIDTDDRH
ncbi:hypothetical protein ACFE04_029462 [Oxalis oulophora]